jgi:hypothetical protein
MLRKIRITLVVLAAVAMASLVQATLLPRAPGTTSTFPRGVQPEAGMSSVEGEWNGGPRECDLPNGISTACVFMD